MHLRPEIPLHTDDSENDIRCRVTKRKVSGGTWSSPAAWRDTFLGFIISALGSSFLAPPPSHCPKPVIAANT